MADVQALADEVMKLTVMEAMELVKLLEEKGIKPAAMAMPMAMQAAGGAAPAAAEVKTEFTVMLMSAPADKKINVIKEVRAITGLGLKEAKELVEGAPKPVKEGVNKEDSEKLKAQLVAAGAAVELK